MEWWQWLVVVLFLIVFLTACFWGIQVRRRGGGVIAQKGSAKGRARRRS